MDMIEIIDLEGDAWLPIWLSLYSGFFQKVFQHPVKGESRARLA
jgi:hypothetical protein